MPRDHIHILTVERLRKDFDGSMGLVCARCHRVLRALDTIVEYPIAEHRYMIICEPCLDDEIRRANWTPPS